LATAVFGQSITFSAAVAVVAPGGGTPAGTITFKDGASVLGKVTLSGGLASFSFAKLTPGSHSITAVFASTTGNFAASTSLGVSESIQQAATKTKLSGPSTAVSFGQTVTLKAQVTAVAPGAGTPTGTVTFMEGSTVLGTGTLVNGIATFQTRTLSKGTHTITAVYNDDSNFLTSISLSLVVTIR
jgi:tetrahydromethanopterin S-methyltransferase subunit E